MNPKTRISYLFAFTIHALMLPLPRNSFDQSVLSRRGPVTLGKPGVVVANTPTPKSFQAVSVRYSRNNVHYNNSTEYNKP